MPKNPRWYDFPDKEKSVAPVWPHIDLSGHFPLPANVLGYLSLDAGMLRVNATAEEMLITSPISQRCVDLFLTRIHETYHLLQMITCGYLYGVACVSTSHIMNVVFDTLGTDPSTWTWDRVSRLLATPPPLPPESSRILNQLSSCNGGPVSVIDIVESSALFFEAHALLPQDEWSLDSYLSFLKKRYASMPEYRRAFEFAAPILGAEQWDLFLYAAVVSLCSFHPTRTFPLAVQLVRDGGRPASLADCEDFALRIGRALSKEARFVGTAGEMISGGVHDTHMMHPYFTLYRRMIGQVSNSPLLLSMACSPARAIESGATPWLAHAALSNDGLLVGAGGGHPSSQWFYDLQAHRGASLIIAMIASAMRGHSPTITLHRQGVGLAMSRVEIPTAGD